MVVENVYKERYLMKNECDCAGECFVWLWSGIIKCLECCPSTNFYLTQITLSSLKCLCKKKKKHLIQLYLTDMLN